MKTFVADITRDAYLDKIIKWISEEQFNIGDKLEIGKLCRAFDDEKEDEAIIGELLAVLPEYCKGRYIVRSETCIREWDYYDNAQPLKCLYPEIKGDVLMDKKKCNYLNELIPSIVFNSRPELWVNYLAINRDGTVVFFENHPNLLHNQWGRS